MTNWRGKLIATISTATLCMGCSPIKGYPGPERPKEELVTIFTKSSDGTVFKLAEVDGVSFLRSGIQLLPGSSPIRIRYSARGEGQNCGMDRLYDNYPATRWANEDTCRRRNTGDPNACASEWTNEPMRLECDYLRTEYECFLQAPLRKPGNYSVQVDFLTQSLQLDDGVHPITFECITVESWWQREKMA
jgi:hypothetical protein